MAKQKFGLGRGLDALISGASEVLSSTQQQTSSQTQTDAQTTVEIPIDSIIPNPRQPRRFFGDDDPKLLELSVSIKEHGLIQPIVVTRLDNSAASGKEQAAKEDIAASSWFGEDEQPQVPAQATQTAQTPDDQGATQESNAVHYQIIAGERRWRAARLAGLSTVSVILKEVTPLQMLELALIENIQRSDLNPIEEALAYQVLVQEFGLTQEMVAKQVGKDRSTVTNSLRLLQLAPKVRDALINQPERFSEGHARALIGITREEDQVTAMNKIIALHLNVRQAEELAAQIKASQDINAAVQQISAKPRRSPEIADLESHFRDALMVKVDLKYNTKGKGTLVLHFNDQEELERLYSQLVKREE